VLNNIVVKVIRERRLKMKRLLIVITLVVVMMAAFTIPALAKDKDGVVDSVGDTRAALNAAGEPGAVADAIAAWKLLNPGEPYGQALKAYIEFLHGK
jgi:hypothetical protein